MNQDRKRTTDPESILARLGGGKSEAKYHRNKIIYSQGDHADFVFYIRVGTVKVAVVSEAGKEAIVAMLQPGDFCGEDCLTGHKRRRSTVTALTECVLARMPGAGITGALRDDAEFLELFEAFVSMEDRVSCLQRPIPVENNAAAENP